MMKKKIIEFTNFFSLTKTCVMLNAEVHKMSTYLTRINCNFFDKECTLQSFYLTDLISSYPEIYFWYGFEFFYLICILWKKYNSYKNGNKNLKSLKLKPCNPNTTLK